MNFDDLSELSINDLWERLNETEMAEKADTALVLSRRLLEQRSYTDSVAVCEQAVQIGEQLQDSRVQGEAWFRVGICSYALDRYEESAEAYLKSVPFYLSESDENSAANAIRHAVDGLEKQSKYEEVVRICEEGETYAQISEHEHLLAELLAARASALIELERYTEALAVLESVRKLWKEHHAVHRIIATDMQRGDCYDALEDNERALAVFKDAYELALAADSRKMIVYQGLRLAKAYDMADDFAPAERVLTRAYEVAAHHDDFAAMGSCNAWMSNIYRQTERPELAYETALKALTLFDSVDTFEGFDQTVAAAVLVPIAREQLDWLNVERAAKLMLSYHFSVGADYTDATEMAIAALDMFEAQSMLGTFTSIDEAHSELIELGFNAATAEQQVTIGHRRVALELEALVQSESWADVIDRAPSMLGAVAAEPLTDLHGRMYVALSKAQKAQGQPSAATLALAASVYFSLNRYEVALELQDEVVSTAVAELTALRDAYSSDLPDKARDLLV